MVLEAASEGAGLVAESLGGLADSDSRFCPDTEFRFPASQHMRNGGLGHTEPPGNVFHPNRHQDPLLRVITDRH